MNALKKLALPVAAVALLAACGGSTTSSSSPASPSGAAGASPAAQAAPAVPAGAVMVTLEDYDIMPATLDLKPGHVVFYVKNTGKTPHNFTLNDGTGKALFNTPNINLGQAVVLQADISPAATKYICTQPGHRSLGMEGTLTVN
ncbi:MAG: cupredoxin domain-containing protein [Candidatus Dormibacteraeota bacterium]|nr:cupredoxin domain-containing protein [Candidatus Dormibacteraeota bacterium]